MWRVEGSFRREITLVQIPLYLAQYKLNLTAYFARALTLGHSLSPHQSLKLRTLVFNESPQIRVFSCPTSLYHRSRCESVNRRVPFGGKQIVNLLLVFFHLLQRLEWTWRPIGLMASHYRIVDGPKAENVRAFRRFRRMARIEKSGVGEMSTIYLSIC